MENLIRNEYRRGMITVALLFGMGLLATAATWGFAWVGPAVAAAAWICLAFSVLFGLILLIIWVIEGIQTRRASEFLDSDRVLARWAYSPEEWRQIREAAWQDEKDDWKVQLGCLTFLLALAGALTGGMIGLEESLLSALGGGLAGLVLGGLVGGVLGTVTAAGNHYSVRMAHRDTRPGSVALGRHEVFAGGNYFRGNGVSRYVRDARLCRAEMTTLELEIVMPPRPRMPSEEHWVIPVPANWVDRVEAILPALMA